MFTVKGEHYFNDYTRETFVKGFSSLEEIFNWLQKTSGNFNGRYGNYFPTVKRYGEEIDVGQISVVDGSKRGWEYWIYEISTPDGIVFANGETTNHNRFCAKKIEEWLGQCQKRLKDIQNKPKFIEL